MLLQMALFHSCLWLSSSLLCIYTTFLSIHLWMTLSIAAVTLLCDIGVDVSFWVRVLSGYMGLLDHMVILFLVF